MHGADILDALRRLAGGLVILFITLPLIAISIPMSIVPAAYRWMDRMISASGNLADRIVCT